MTDAKLVESIFDWVKVSNLDESEHVNGLKKELLKRMAIPAAQTAPQPFFPIDTAPKDGTHILAADFTPGKVGFGGNPQQAYYCVVHWFQWCDGTHPEEAGWYPSTGAGDSNPMTNLTHWQPLQPLAAQPAPGWISVEERLPEDDSEVFAAIWWIDRTVPDNSHYEIHDCSYYEGGEESGQKIFADCEGEEFEAADVSFWIYKKDLAKQFAPPEPAQEPNKEKEK